MGPKSKVANGAGGKEEHLLQAVVVADSFDSTFAPLSHRLPRCLFPLANRPLIDYTLAALSASGAVSEVFVYCTSHAQGGNSIGFFGPRNDLNIGPKTGPKCHLERIHA